MRVISGKYRGRKILPPINNNVRPTYDKVKEAMFALLTHCIDDATVIDLFAGTGNLGIEALSRGARKVYFCDNSGMSLELIKKNTEYCSENEKEILRGDFSDVIKRLSILGVQADIILCDPPYGKDMHEKALKEIYESGILKSGGTIIVERKQSDKQIKKYFTLVNEKNYGEICLDVYKNITKCAVTGTFDPFTVGHKYVVEKALEIFDFVHIAMLVNENKQTRYSVEVRKRMIELSLVEYKKRIRIDYYEGMAIDYANENGIKMLIRGYRDSQDKKYEEEMALYNKEHGDVDTVFIKGENTVSSSEVKKVFDNGEDVSGYVCDDVERLMRRFK